jgi:hypothetical protein
MPTLVITVSIDLDTDSTVHIITRTKDIIGARCGAVVKALR